MCTKQIHIYSTFFFLDSMKASFDSSKFMPSYLRHLRTFKSLALKGAFLFSCLSCKNAFENESATWWTLCQANCFPREYNFTLLKTLVETNLDIILDSIVAIQTLVCTSNYITKKEPNTNNPFSKFDWYD